MVALTGLEPAFSAPLTISSLEDCLGYKAIGKVLDVLQEQKGLIQTNVI